MTTSGGPHTVGRRAFGAFLVALLGFGPIAAAAATVLSSTGTSSNVTAVWTEPAAGYGFLLAAIDSARHSVDMSMYELDDHAVEAALVSRARTGVVVQVLLDSAYSGRRVSGAAASVLSAGGVRVAWAPEAQIFHAKYLIVDGRIAYIGTGNLVASDYSSTRDFWVTDSTPHDVAAITSTFTRDFADEPGPGVASNGLVWSPGSTSRLLALIDSARSTLLVENEEMDSATIERALAGDARRGVDVKIVLTENSAWTTALRGLAAAGDHVRVLNAEQTYIHAKVLCADCSSRAGTAFIGSENFSTSSLADNRELGVITTSVEAVQAVRDAVTTDFLSGHVLAAPASSAPPAHVAFGVTITSLDSSVSPGEEDTLTVHSSRPHDSCSLSVQLPSGYESESKGLGMATADQSGDVTWQWEIGPSTRNGVATASVSCGAGTSSRPFTIT